MIVTFDRIGSRRDVAPLNLNDDASADGVAEAVYRYARRFLNSTDFEVIVNFDRATVSIEFGRFGSGTISTDSESDHG